MDTTCTTTFLTWDTHMGGLSSGPLSPSFCGTFLSPTTLCPTTEGPRPRGLPPGPACLRPGCCYAGEGGKGGGTRLLGLAARCWLLPSSLAQQHCSSVNSLARHACHIAWPRCLLAASWHHICHGARRAASAAAICKHLTRHINLVPLAGSCSMLTASSLRANGALERRHL